MFFNCLAVGVGGFCGSVLRYLISQIPLQNKGNFPINTLITNIIGAVLIGAIIAYASKSDMSPEKLLMLKVGLCGGLTTFSTFSVESLGLIQNGNIWAAALYILLSVGICVIGVYIGMKLV